MNYIPLEACVDPLAAELNESPILRETFVASTNGGNRRGMEDVSYWHWQDTLDVYHDALESHDLTVELDFSACPNFNSESCLCIQTVTTGGNKRSRRCLVLIQVPLYSVKGPHPFHLVFKAWKAKATWLPVVMFVHWQTGRERPGTGLA